MCVQPQQVHVPEEELSVPLLASPNTNWIVKVKQLLFGNVVINSGLHPVEYHSLSKKHMAMCVVAVSRSESLPLRALYKCFSLIFLFSVFALTAFILRGWLGDVLVNGAVVQKHSR